MRNVEYALTGKIPFRSACLSEIRDVSREVGEYLRWQDDGEERGWR